MASNLHKSVRRELILANALEMVRESGFAAITCAAVAARCDCGATTIQRFFQNKEVLSREIVKYAETIGDEAIVKLGKRLFG